MTLKQSKAPYISQGDSTQGLMTNVILSLLIIYGMAFFFYGPRALLVGLVGIVTALITEWVCLLIGKKKIQLYDFSPIVTGLIIPLTLPASVPFQVIVVATCFGLAVAKHPFGGTGHNVFNPAAAGYAFVVTCYSSEILFKYPQPASKWLPIFGLSEIPLFASPTASLGQGLIPASNPVTLILGNVPGPMGATNMFVLLACLVFLITRRTIRWQTPIVFLLTTAVFSFAFPRFPAEGISRLYSVLFEVMAGPLLFCAVFMLNDPVTTPKRSWAKIAYAVIAGIIVMLFRRFGNVEEGSIFALLLMNATVWGFDYIFEKVAAKARRARYEAIAD